MDVNSLSPSQLSPAHREAWEGLRASGAGLDNPFFALDFYTLLEEVRGGVEIAVVEENGTPVAFLPLERTGGAATAAGWLVSEIHGPIADERSRWDAAEVLSRLGLASWRFACVPAAQRPLAPYHLRRRNFPAIDLGGGAAAYFQRRKHAGSRQIQEVNRKARQLERQHGELRFEWHTGDARAMELLLRWKSRQHRETGTREVLSVKWVVELLHALWRRGPAETRGVLSALYCGDQVIAAHVGLAGGGVLNWWYPSYDRRFARCSPGSILLLRCIEAAAERGIRRIDLGQGDERYKQSFADAGFEVAEGAVDQRVFRRAMRSAWIQTREWAAASPLCTGPLRVFRAARNRVLARQENGA